MTCTNNRVGQLIRSSLVGGEAYEAYVPANLPPDPPLDMGALYPLLDQANTALGRLDGMSMVLPDAALFLYMYVRKEAVLSSQIEGTQSSLSDLLLFETDEAPGVPMDDVTEVSCYVAAMDYGLERLKSLPLSLRLLREIHAKLMSNARGGDKTPGEFRSTQNWIGGSRPSKALFVPPPPERLNEALDAFEKFLHDERVKLPVLIKAALAHVQFETIHPFLDGNGRLGRLLITFILCAEGVLKEPLLYLSLYLKANRQAYYDHLQSVRTTGDWEAWIKFFLTGVIEVANQATDTARAVLALFSEDRAKIANSGKSTATVLAIHAYLQRHPVATTTRIKEACKVSLPTALRGLATLEALGIVREATGKERHKVFVYQAYLDILNQGTEPFAR
ncbi:Fic family protein [Methylocystis sp. MJC1]|uniref:Fic family protein n=1 Tax=Methylocystis sp. MJC1 TaxID=2654282 RepID=UPI0013EB06DB|nr:Fic family protein [Methylocystis sp. MJC1]KAF2990303.1 Adenosine monophosphate-protein transferase SoFic [Methylocystis sp. MJC1]MBU6528001.1 Fic family protein [Methylocystis sp. MJC1]UZX10920.1 Fic family protein [Methylocystis sp. MJC1]